MELSTAEKYSSILKLQAELNSELRAFFESNKNRGREFLSSALIEKVESMVEALNSKSFQFRRCDYGGDINYEDSEQYYSSGQEMGAGIVLHFHGFAVQASWSNA
ncbi:hypothetical protein [Gilvimarinus agarilyticus]|uniref:hypothetical protein n=1 Tax=Gilvimarinus agarilyticus TaxID=679259 RepID=UPI0005A0E1B5|nr:hypothetical protein [Gilvimarinus agarilyticus]